MSVSVGGFWPVWWVLSDNLCTFFPTQQIDLQRRQLSTLKGIMTCVRLFLDLHWEQCSFLCTHIYKSNYQRCMFKYLDCSVSSSSGTARLFDPVHYLKASRGCSTIKKSNMFSSTEIIFCPAVLTCKCIMSCWWLRRENLCMLPRLVLQKHLKSLDFIVYHSESKLASPPQYCAQMILVNIPHGLEKHPQ